MLLYIFSFLLFLLLGFLLFVYTGPQLPEGINDLIKEIQNEPLPELITGQTGIVKREQVSIFYESMGGKDPSKGAVMLVGGLAQTLLGWPPYFYQPFVDAGYQVVRMDNRGVGESDWLRNWNKEAPYHLEDMAKDVLAVLDSLEIKKAHVIGVSMGGMISQRLAISHADRVLSLTSIMSTGFYHDPELVQVPPKFYRNFLRWTFRYIGRLKKEENRLKFHLGTVRMLRGNGDYPFESRRILRKALYELRKRKGFNAKVVDQHSAAIVGSGSRYEELGAITVPTLVIHGKADPLVTFEHAQKYAPMIPGADTLFIEGMGHDLPRKYSPEIIEQIQNTFKKAAKITL